MHQLFMILRLDKVKCIAFVSSIRSLSILILNALSVHDVCTISFAGKLQHYRTIVNRANIHFVCP